MKWLVLIFIAFFVIACSKHSASENYPLQAKMNTTTGKTISAFFLDEETKFSKGLSTQGDEITIWGLKKDGAYSLTLVIIRPKVGTFDLSSGPDWLGTNCNATIPYPSNFYISWGKGSGSIMIEALTDTTIKGRFNAVCIGTGDTLRITNGSFNGKFR